MKSLLTTAITFCCLCFPVLLLAQGDPGEDPDPIPLDGGLSLLIGAGVAYGFKKAHDARKKNRQAKEQEKI